MLFRCHCCDLKGVSLLCLKLSQIEYSFKATLNITSHFQSQIQYSTAANLKVILCEVLSRYIAHPNLTEEKMLANIHQTFCFTDSSLLESFTQEFRRQLSQVSTWDPFLLSAAQGCATHIIAVFGEAHLARSCSSLYQSASSP